MDEYIIVLNTGNDDIEVKEIDVEVTTIPRDGKGTIPIVFSSDPSDIKEWKIELGQNGACEFHQGHFLGGADPVAEKKATLLLSVQELSGGNHLKVKVHGRPKNRRSGSEVPGEKGKRKVAVTRNGNKIKSASYFRASTSILIQK